MFTGIIEDIGKVYSLSRGVNSARLSIKSVLLRGQKVGDSVSINGVCLTISGLKDDTAVFDVVEETLSRSNLQYLRNRDKVNMERSLKVGDRMGGHFVTGHIDCLGGIEEMRKEGDHHFILIRVPQEVMVYVVEKGSVALNGVSLTVAKVNSGAFGVYIIPHTMKSTIFSEFLVGNRVNIEFDLLGKYSLKIDRDAKPERDSITEEKIRKSGFVKR